MLRREVRCQCGVLNRVPSYWVSRIPKCGSCHALLSESWPIGALRYASRGQTIPVVTVSLIVALVVWLSWTLNKPISAMISAPPTAPAPAVAALPREWFQSGAPTDSAVARSADVRHVNIGSAYFWVMQNGSFVLGRTLPQFTAVFVLGPANDTSFVTARLADGLSGTIAKSALDTGSGEAAISPSPRKGLSNRAKLGESAIVRSALSRPQPESCGPPLWRASAFLGFWVRQAPCGTPRIGAVVDQPALSNRVAPRGEAMWSVEGLPVDLRRAIRDAKIG
jgi:hypothetical protein